MRCTALCSAIVAAILAGGPVALAEVIDDFTTGPIALFAEYQGPAATATQTGLPSGHVAGGARDWKYSVWKAFGADVEPGSGVAMTVDTSSGGSLIYQADTDLSAVNFTLVYGGSAAPDMLLDLAAGGNTALALDFAYASFAGGWGLLDVTMYSPADHVYRPVRVDDSAGPMTVLVPFEVPNDPYHGNLDPSAVTRIEIGAINGNLFGDFALTGIRAVPEPSTALMFIGGAVLFLITRLRRR